MTLSTAYEFLRPCKKLSQMIAQSWRTGQKLPFRDKTFLIDNGLFSAEEIELFEVRVYEAMDPKSTRLGDNAFFMINAVTLEIHIWVPERPSDVTDEALDVWLASNTSAAPWLPQDPALRSHLGGGHAIVGVRD